MCSECTRRHMKTYRAEIASWDLSEHKKSAQLEKFYTFCIQEKQQKQLFFKKKSVESEGKVLEKVQKAVKKAYLTSLSVISVISSEQLLLEVSYDLYQTVLFILPPPHLSIQLPSLHNVKTDMFLVRNS